MPDETHARALQNAYEPRPDPQSLTGHDDPALNSSTGVDYEPHPASSVPISASRQAIVTSICDLYSGSASEEDMRVYSKEAIYDDPWSYCDTRYKIAGQWYGIPKAMSSSRTLSTEVVASDPERIVFKLRQEYTPRVLNISKAVNSLVTLTLAEEEGEKERKGEMVEKVKYHKDMWNEKDYSHEGLGKVMKTLQSDHMTKITRPPQDL